MYTTIFCEVDDFCKFIEKELATKLLTCGKKRIRECRMEPGEVMTIMIMFHFSGYKNFKAYYQNHVCIYQRSDFHNLVSYSRFIELKQKLLLPFYMFARMYCLGKCTGISFMDSFPLKTSHIKRRHKNIKLAKVFTKGKTSTGWFRGLKFHIVINHQGEIIDFGITPGNVADNNKTVICSQTEKLFGLLIGDKGYIGANRHIKSKKVRLITRVRKNMKPPIMTTFEKLLLRKRGIVETVNGLLKETLSIEHSRHRSLQGIFIHIFASVAAYHFRFQKPALEISCMLIS